MKSLCSDIQRHHLLKLVRLVRDKTLSGTQAWTAFSVPQASKTFKLKDGSEKKIDFTLVERKTYQALREAVQLRLFQQYGRSCAYCRRPVGHYGYDWHIEHVLPKARYAAHTFRLANLTVGCVHCNRWKGASVDREVKQKILPIINPLEPGFQYSQHLRYLQLSTEEMSFAKYSPLSNLGTKTYILLRLDELERVHAVNSLDGSSAALHERLTRAMSVGLTHPEGQQFLALLSDLKSAVYRRPSSPLGT
jgi:uncharacterized protein (TIGR02646 family)